MNQTFGKHLPREDLLRRVGNMSQIASIRHYTYSSGRAAGVQAIEITNGPFSCEVLPSRCLDVGALRYKGIPLGYVSKSGLRHPAFYNRLDPTGFQDNFLAGLLTTCGMHTIGPASSLGGRDHQLHGELANMPADNVCAREKWTGDDCEFTVSGDVHHSAFYREDLILRRRIATRLGEASIRIDDEVENLDFAPSPCILLYHIQFGYPLLDETTKLYTSPRNSSRVRHGTPAGELDTFDSFGPPVDGAEEACFYHNFTPGSDGFAAACLFNPTLGEKGIGAYVRFDTASFPYFVQWKMLRSREYVCGLEPATAPLDDRTEEQIAGATLHPLEKRIYRLEVGVVEGEDAVHRLLE